MDAIIVAPAEAISYAIMSVGKFLGLGEYHVDIPFNQFKGGNG